MNNNNLIPKEILDSYNLFQDRLYNMEQSNSKDIDELFNYLTSHNFLELPASLNHHLRERGGLVIHSVNVAKILIDLTEKLGLTWERPESPIIIGLLHDICKLEFYAAEKIIRDQVVKFKHNDHPEFNLGGHGMLSVVLAQRFIKLTDEEIHCIRFHMGAYEQKDWSMFDAAIKKYPNVLYTHTADMIASKIIER